MIHETTIRVRYGEVDRMGVVYHAHYLPYFEVGRTEFLRSLGRAYREVEEAGMLLVVADAALRFRRPANYDDVLRVRTRLVSATGVRIVFEYEVDRPADATRIATGHTTLAATDLDGRPTRIPDGFRAMLDAVVEPSLDADGAAKTTGSPSAGAASADRQAGTHAAKAGKNPAAAPVQGQPS